MPKMSTIEKRAMSIMGFFRNDNGETGNVSCDAWQEPRSKALTSTPLLIIVLLPNGLNLNHQAIPTFPSCLSFIIPLVSNERLPCADHLLLLPAAFNRLLHGDVYAQWFESEVSAVHGSEVTASRDIIEVEGVRARYVGV